MTEEIKKESRGKAAIKITRAAWRVVKLDKELLGIGLLSAAIGLLVFGVFAFASLMLILSQGGFSEEYGFQLSLQNYIIFAVYLLFSAIIANFFSGAVAHGAFERFDGRNPTFKSALQAAWAKKLPLIAFSGLQTTVGLILNLIEERVPLGGKIAVWLTGAAWHIATLFSIPVIMSSEEKNPLKVVKRSALIFKNIWAESVFIGLGIGVIGVIFGFVSVIVVIAGMIFAASLGSTSLAIGVAAVFVLAVIVFSIIMSVLRTVLMSAAFYYSVHNKIPAGFDEQLIRSMFRPKKKWLKA